LSTESDYTEQTLPSGEVVRCYGPCERFPQGRRVLAPANRLRDRLQRDQEELGKAFRRVRQREHDRLCRARALLDAGEPVPHEKRVI